MAIYKILGEKERLEAVSATSFGEEGVLERTDLQRMLRDQPEALEEGLLIIAEEFLNWQDSNRRIDLLGLDSNGCLTVIELKRGDTGEHMDLQAIRYAAMVANMTFQQAVDAYQDYLQKRAREKGETIEEDAADTGIREHLGVTESDTQALHTETPRIILASENFSKELTTCVMWLNDSWLRNERLEIKCIRLQPHRNGDEILVETSVVIPLPEASEYQIGVVQREKERRGESVTTSTEETGSNAFQESISQTPEEFRTVLNQLHDFAVCLENKHRVELSTISKDGTSRKIVDLHLKLPDSSGQLTTFSNFLRYKGNAKGGHITFWDGSELAPKTWPRLDKLIDPVKSPSGIRNRFLSKLLKKVDIEDVFQVICEAYEEAASQVTSTSRPPIDS